MLSSGHLPASDKLSSEDGSTFGPISRNGLEGRGAAKRRFFSGHSEAVLQSPRRRTLIVVSGVEARLTGRDASKFAGNYAARHGGFHDLMRAGISGIMGVCPDLDAPLPSLGIRLGPTRHISFRYGGKNPIQNWIGPISNAERHNCSTLN